ncbi:hypothetical protein FQN54_003674 [Arachnomyces sp. PD_36]|nr:hypothetical protein FQN54_003674 [Arachnomyces sp. PD_36]
MASAATQDKRPAQKAVGQQQPQQPQLQPPATALIIYPITLFIGSLYSLISPTAQATVSETSTFASSNSASRPGPVNYFARKNNIFNLYFVKIGWLWTTLAFVVLIIAHPAYTNPRVDSTVRFRRAAQAALRYLLITITWILTTQWFFGPAIIDRSFRATGGRCENPPSAIPGEPLLSELEAVVTAAACKAAGGSWSGGHDVSGHVFMLVLASASLTLEMLGASWSAARDEGEETRDKKQDGDLPVVGGAWSLGAAWFQSGLV